MNRAPGSFRDPSGQVFMQDGQVYRTINECYRAEWAVVKPFLSDMASAGLVVPFDEVEPVPGAFQTLKLRKLPFISYPYEWSCDQLRDAALLTLDLHKRALKRGLILKDASAYNIGFVGAKPVFIDHLSFERWTEGKPWGAYRQFCSHFVAPLALMSSVDLSAGLLSRLWIDGIPLPVAAAMMPLKRRLNAGLNFHLFLHARMQRKYENAEEHAEKATATKVTREYLIRFAESLERLISGKALRLPDAAKTEWGDYYAHTNYTEDAADEKAALVAAAAEAHDGALAIDLGANTGRYTSRIAAHFDSVIAADIDPLAVNRHYALLKGSKTHHNVLPLIVDFTNPSPAIGFNNAERTSFIDRVDGDFVLALALIHHLRITGGIPLDLIADFFARLMVPGGVLMLEFVPKEDSQTQKLLALREDVFADYTLDRCAGIFAERFTLLDRTPITGSCRTMLKLKKK